MNECIICNASESTNDYVEDPSINSLENLLAREQTHLKTYLQENMKDSSLKTSVCRILLNRLLSHLLRI